MPWKNGLGSTTEVARWPEGDGAEFVWRLSVARVEGSGPFSRFPGYDRIIVPLDGAMTLECEGGRTHISSLHAHAFSGDAVTSGTPDGGSVRDLNVMTRRGKAKASVEILSGPRTSVFEMADGEISLFYIASGDLSVASTRATAEETIMTDGESSLSFESRGAAQVILSRIRLEI